MNWERILNIWWHGTSAAILAGATALAVLQAWPSKFQWLILGAGMAAAFVKGVNGFVTDPEGKA
jgi:hypothetical protein